MADNKFYFGSAIAFSFTAGEGEQAPDSIVSARLYADVPTQAQIDDEADALGDAVERVTSWSSGTSTNEKVISFAAVDDPDPSDSDDIETYYVVVNFKWDSGGSTVVTRPAGILLRRTTVLTSRFGVVAADVYAVEAKIEALKGDSWTTTKITLAEKEVIADLQDRIEGFELHRLALSDASELVRFKATELACNDISAETGDRWDTNAKEHAEKYEKRFRTLKARYDYDADGVQEETETTTFGVASFGRI